MLDLSAMKQSSRGYHRKLQESGSTPDMIHWFRLPPWILSIVFHSYISKYKKPDWNRSDIHQLSITELQVPYLREISEIPGVALSTFHAENEGGPPTKPEWFPLPPRDPSGDPLAHLAEGITVKPYAVWGWSVGCYPLVNHLRSRLTIWRFR